MSNAFAKALGEDFTPAPTEALEVEMNAEEKAFILYKAKAIGLTPSEYLRIVLLNGFESMKYNNGEVFRIKGE